MIAPRTAGRLLPLLAPLALLAIGALQRASAAGPAAPPAPSAAASTEPVYAGVWRGGGGGARLTPASPRPELERQSESLGREGLRLVSIGAFYDRATESVLYAGVWRPGGGVQETPPAMVWSQFTAQNLAYSQRGLRLAALAIFDRRGQTTYAGVWRDGLGDATRWTFAAAPWGVLAGEDRTLAAQGLRIAGLAAARDRDGHLVYSGFWLPGSGAWHLEPGLAWSAFASLDETEGKAGLHLAALAVYRGDDGTLRYAGAWREEAPAGGAGRIAEAATWPELAAIDTRATADGLRPIAVAIVPPSPPPAAPIAVPH